MPSPAPNPAGTPSRTHPQELAAPNYAAIQKRFPERAEAVLWKIRGTLQAAGLPEPLRQSLMGKAKRLAAACAEYGRLKAHPRRGRTPVSKSFAGGAVDAVMDQFQALHYESHAIQDAATRRGFCRLIGDLVTLTRDYGHTLVATYAIGRRPTPHPISEDVQAALRDPLWFQKMATRPGNHNLGGV